MKPYIWVIWEELRVGKYDQNMLHDNFFFKSLTKNRGHIVGWERKAVKSERN